MHNDSFPRTMSTKLFLRTNSLNIGESKTYSLNQGNRSYFNRVVAARMGDEKTLLFVHDLKRSLYT